MATIHVDFSPEAKSRRRRIAEAEAYLAEHLGRRWRGRSEALESVHKSPQPLRRARELVSFHQRQRVLQEPGRSRQRQTSTSRQVADLSDTQELVARLMNRDGCICPVHRGMIEKLDRQIATEGLSKGEFQIRAAQILSLPQALPKGLMEDERRLRGMGSPDPGFCDPKPLEDQASQGLVYVDRWGFRHRTPAGNRVPATST